jgi:hypothetical protein
VGGLSSKRQAALEHPTVVYMSMSYDKSKRTSTSRHHQHYLKMPHRVVDFFRSPNDSIHTIKQTVQRRTSPAARRTQSKERHRPTRTSSYGTDGTVEDHTLAPPVKMPETTKEKHKEHHRLNFPGLHLGGHKTQKDLSQNPSASLDWKIESAPAVMHGSPEESSGALVSGQLLLCVKEECFEVESLEAKLEIHVTQKKPFNGHCHDCAVQKTELKRWSFLSEPVSLTQRACSHSCPHGCFSWLT